MIRKKSSDVQCYRTIKERARHALAFILKLCGVNDVSNNDKSDVEEIMKEAMLMLREKQVQASFVFRVEPPSLKEIDYDITDEEKKKEEVNVPERKEVEDVVRSKLSNKDFDFVKNKLKLCTSGAIDMDSNHVVSKETRRMVKPYKVKNAEYRNDASNTISTTNQLSANLVRNEENEHFISQASKTRIHFWSNVTN